MCVCVCGGGGGVATCLSSQGSAPLGETGKFHLIYALDSRLWPNYQHNDVDKEGRIKALFSPHTHTHTLNNGNNQQVSLFTMEWWGDGQAVQSRSTDQGALDLAMSPSLSWCAMNIPCRAPVKSIQHLWSVSRYEFDSDPLALPVLNINKPHVASVDISITITHKLKRPPRPPRKKGK